MNGQVNVYTMDHRGTGRSARLDCIAAQATTSGSPGGDDVEPEEVAACAEDLKRQYGSDLSSFSITSAASDLASFISTFQSGSKTFVYGLSYGTAFTERLIHLNVPEIVGYILDGIATTSGSKSADRFEYYSNWDKDFS